MSNEEFLELKKVATSNLTFFDYKGSTYYCKEPAISDDYNNEPAYMAIAYTDDKVDEEGNMIAHKVIWLYTDEYKEALEKFKNGNDYYEAFVEDASNACDWENPYKVIELCL